MKKIIKISIAAVLLLIQFLVISKTVNAANIGEIKELERGELGYYCIQKWNGSKWIYLTYNQTFYTDTDGQKYIAYCLSPGLPGVGYVTGEKDKYQVKIDNIFENDVIWRILKNGYPNKPVEKLGVETSDDAYFATMQAINAVLRGYNLEQAKQLYCVGQFAINGQNYDDIQRRGKKTLDAMFNLIDIGLNGTETRSQFLKVSIEKTSQLIDENEKFYSQTFKVKSSSEISKFEIARIEGLPDNSYITDINGNSKQVFSGEEQFKVMIPKDIKSEEIKGNIIINIMKKNYPVYFGTSQIEGFQDYALCNNSYSNVQVTTNINERLNKSKLTIIKVDDETNKPLEAVKFKITYSDGTTKEISTNKNGKIEIDDLIPGEITIKEIETIGKYRLNRDEIKVNLKYEEEKEIIIKNELQKGGIKVIKVDKENNEIRLKKVKFQLKDENNNVITEGNTDENGELLFENLIIGKYKIIEIETNSEYNLLEKEFDVIVLDNEIKELKIENEKKEIPKEDIPQNEIPEVPEENNPQDETSEVPQENKKLPKTGEFFDNNCLLSKTIFTIGLGSICFIGKYKKKEE